MKKICLIDGHPDPDPARLIHALCKSYADGALSAGHDLSLINISELNPEPLRVKSNYVVDPDASILQERQKIQEADHLVLAFPLWLGSMPSATRAFFEQASRGAFFINEKEQEYSWPTKMMDKKSARIIVTMGMPGFIYRTMMGSASLKALERGLLGIAGFKPVKHTILGGVENTRPDTIQKWFEEMHELGTKGI